MQLREWYYHFLTVFTQKIRVNSADGDQRANPLTERTEKASLGGKYGGRGVYEALSVCGQYYDSVMVGGGLHS